MSLSATVSQHAVKVIHIQRNGKSRKEPSLGIQVCGANVRPRWRLLQHIEVTGVEWYTVTGREERFFTNRSNQPGDGLKDEVRTDDDLCAWSN